MSAFDAMERAMAAEHDRAFAIPAELHPMSGAVNDEPAPDPARAVTALEVIWDEAPARVDLGDNGPGGRARGQFGLSQAARGVFASIRRELLPFEVLEGDELRLPSRPGRRWRVAEPMPDGEARIRVRLNEVA